MPTAKAKRADGRYQVSVYLGLDSSGKRQQKYFYGDTQKEAKAKRDEWLKKSDDEKKAPKPVITVADWADKWLEVFGGGGYTTSNTNKNAVEKLKTAVGTLKMTDIKKSDIKIFANDLAEYSFSMVKKVKGVVNRIFEEAVADRIIDLNPCLGVKWDHDGKGTHRALEEWERDLIAKNWREHRCGLWAMLMLFAGLRRGEALALQWKDVDWKGNVIHVTKALHFEGNAAVLEDTPKTLAGVRSIPIQPPLLAALKAHKGPQEASLCVPADGGSMSEAAFRKGWQSYLNSMANILNGEKAIQPGRRSRRPKLDDLGKEIPRRHFIARTHDLRHTFCTMLYEADVDLKTAQYLMGHADAEMTIKVYTHLSETKRQASYEKLQKFTEKWI